MDVAQHGTEPQVAAKLPSPENVPPVSTHVLSKAADNIDRSHLREGMTVKLFGLISAVDLNGRTGKLGAFDVASGRWSVTLFHTKMSDGGTVTFDNERSSVNVKPKNMIEQLVRKRVRNDDSVCDDHADDAILTPETCLSSWCRSAVLRNAKDTKTSRLYDGHEDGEVIEMKNMGLKDSRWARGESRWDLSSRG